MSVMLSLMDKADLTDVLEVSTLSLKESWSLDSFANELTNPLAKYIVAKADNRVIGFAGVWIIAPEGHITNIAVHPDYRKNGVGSSLVNSLIENCTNKWGCDALTLEVRASNIPAQKLYEKFGFANEGIRKKYYSDNNEDAIIMWKR